MTTKLESDSYVAFQALSPSFKELEEFEARGRQIVECETQVQYWKEKLVNLFTDQEKYYRLARLRLDTQSNGLDYHAHKIGEGKYSCSVSVRRPPIGSKPFWS